MKRPNLLLFALLLCALNTSAQIPGLSSNPSASATIYLDFDGQYVTATSWNWGGPITALPAPLTQTSIIEIFHRVAEDYRIFNVNVTTDSNVFKAAPVFQKTRIIITPSSEWYGNAGGVAFVGSFLWGDDTPAWVFSNKLGHIPKYVAEAASHEAGHTLGLQHQSNYDATCKKIAEYGGGQGTGEIGWAPIMGVGYYKNLTTWHRGSNAQGCNVIQNDVEVIGGTDNGFGFRTDDHGDQHTNATSVLYGLTNFTISGIVNDAADKDVFKFDLTYNQNFKLSAIPESVGSNNAGANIDIQVSLLNGSGDTIGKYNPSLLLNAGLDTNLASGTYYVVMEGTGNENLRDYGSLGYYYLSGELNRVLQVYKFRLSGTWENEMHSLSWSYITDEPLKEFEVQVSDDGSRFEKLTTMSSSARNLTYSSLSSKKSFYRVRAVTAADERSYYSNIIALDPKMTRHPVEVMNTVVKNSVTVNSAGNYSYQLLQQNGQILQSGTLKPGRNTIDIKPTANGLLLMRIFDGTQYWTEKLVKQ